MTTRPARLIFVAGTGTAIGKTWMAAAVLARFRSAGLRVGARKPAQSFDAGEEPTDADVPDVVLLVADAGLGTINAVRMSVAAFGERQVVVVLNRFDEHDPLHRSNRDWLSCRDGFDVVTGAEAAAARIVP